MFEVNDGVGFELTPVDEIEGKLVIDQNGDVSQAPLVEIALLTKSLYDLTDFRIALANRIRQYRIEDIWYQERFKDLQRYERDYQKQLEKYIYAYGFGEMADIVGIGARTLGSLIMHCIETERITDSKGKYIGTTFKDQFTKFDGFRSLCHYAGLLPVCKNCGMTESQCLNKETITLKRGDNEHIYTGCGTFVPKAAKALKGKPVTWNDTFRKKLLSIGANLYRHDGPYRKVFLEAREKALELHPDWSKGRNFSHAKKMMMRSVLQDFYNLYLAPKNRNKS